MNRWSSHLYRRDASKADVESSVLGHALEVGSRIVRMHRDIQPVFTLKHLAMASGVEYNLLRRFVCGEKDYDSFPVQKRPGRDGKRRYRIICVPSPALMKVQRWIAQNILSHTVPHEASVAYARGDSLYKAALPHCDSRWLIKLDIRKFFESIPEAAAYRVFLELGFEPLISFEMARICTRVYPGRIQPNSKWASNSFFKSYTIAAYNSDWQGHLPQGAPTSPMLANLACAGLDERLSAIALSAGLVYTRYADDLTFSTVEKQFSREDARDIVKKVYLVIRQFGLRPNKSKASIIPPGGRKIVLGLFVDGKEPRLSRDFKASLRQHLYYLTHEEIGPVNHAHARGFTSVVGLRNHLLGLLGFASQIEPNYASRQRLIFSRIRWPI